MLDDHVEGLKLLEEVHRETLVRDEDFGHLFQESSHMADLLRDRGLQEFRQVIG
ncbi:MULTISPECIES: hypothetical protein [Pacificimonas]|uniref:Uncharacterized protein n=1 Tax=Pacificimonas aurantium TaxID=1250540 RepID=A0ABS7WMM4_9SPHN|nr:MULTISPECIES: hypothetical protein [Pacificimonas]MBZ6379204.1 hypothetical protein [Pacificimonas aurantium]